MERGGILSTSRIFYIGVCSLHRRCSTWYLILHGEKFIDSEGIKVNVIFPLSLFKWTCACLHVCRQTPGGVERRNLSRHESVLDCTSTFCIETADMISNKWCCSFLATVCHSAPLLFPPDKLWKNLLLLLPCQEESILFQGPLGRVTVTTSGQSLLVICRSWSIHNIHIQTICFC